MRRTPSPAGDSTLITSAPKSARWRAAPGPANTVAMSMTRRPASAGSQATTAARSSGRPATAERVVAVQAGEHAARLLGPGHRGGRRRCGGRAACSRLRTRGTRPTRRDSPSRTRSRRSGRRAPPRSGADAVAVRVPGEVAGDRLAARDDRAQRFAVVGIDAEVVVVALGRRRVPRVVVPEHEHGLGRLGRELVEPLELVARRSRPWSVPGRTVSSTASVTPSSSIDERTASPRSSSVIIASWLPRTWCMRSPSRAYARRNASYSSSVPRSVRSPFTSDRVGIERARSRRSRRGSSPRDTARRPARRVKIGPSSSGVAEPAALDLAEVHVVRRSRTWRARAGRLLERRDLAPGSSGEAAAPSTATG